MNLFDSANYPTDIPQTLIAGDRWAWKRTAGDYGTGYALGYLLVPIAGGTLITLSSTLSASDYLIEIAAATTAAYTATTYRYTETITRASDSSRINLGYGTITVAPNPATTTSDTRSHARKVLDAIRATLEGRASLDQESMAINGRSISRTPLADLIALETRYAQLVQREEMAEGIRNGIGRNARQVTVRMA